MSSGIFLCCQDFVSEFLKVLYPVFGAVDAVSCFEFFEFLEYNKFLL